MEASNEKKSGMSLSVTQQRVAFVAIVVIIALVIALILTASTAVRNSRNYAAARNAIGDKLYGCLSNMPTVYARASYPGADTQNDILPNLRDYYNGACYLDDSLRAGFGDSYGVLDTNLRAEIDTAFNAYNSAYARGQSTKDAEELMAQAMIDIDTTLRARYTNEGTIKEK